MRRALVLALVPGALWAAELKIDHVTVAGRDVRKLQSDLQAVGIRSVFGGAHANHTTEMALVSFPDGSYLELMGLQSGAEARLVDEHVWAKYLKGDAGPCAWAVRERDIHAEMERLRAAGIPVSPPVQSGRERPDGTHLAWQTSDIGTGPRGTFFPFLIEDQTARALRAFPDGKPVTRDFRGVTRVVIAVRSLEDAVKRYRQAYGVPPPIKQVDKSFGAYLASAGGGPIILAQPLNPDSWLTERLARFGEGPCAFVLGTAQPARFHQASKSRWFGVDVSWFDPEKLGWRLGFEQAP